MRVFAMMVLVLTGCAMDGALEAPAERPDLAERVLGLGESCGGERACGGGLRCLTATCALAPTCQPADNCGGLGEPCCVLDEQPVNCMGGLGCTPEGCARCR